MPAKISERKERLRDQSRTKGFLDPAAADTLRRLEREDFVFPDLDTSWAQAPAE